MISLLDPNNKLNEHKNSLTITYPKTVDIILIAGKGHENYQENNGVRTHFNDLEEVSYYFNQLKKK